MAVLALCPGNPVPACGGLRVKHERLLSVKRLHSEDDRKVVGHVWDDDLFAFEEEGCWGRKASMFLAKNNSI